MARLLTSNTHLRLINGKHHQSFNNLKSVFGPPKITTGPALLDAQIKFAPPLPGIRSHERHFGLSLRGWPTRAMWPAATAIQ